VPDTMNEAVQYSIPIDRVEIEIEGGGALVLSSGGALSEYIRKSFRFPQSRKLINTNLLITYLKAQQSCNFRCDGYECVSNSGMVCSLALWH